MRGKNVAAAERAALPLVLLSLRVFAGQRGCRAEKSAFGPQEVRKKSMTAGLSVVGGLVGGVVLAPVIRSMPSFCYGSARRISPRRVGYGSSSGFLSARSRSWILRSGSPAT